MSVVRLKGSPYGVKLVLDPAQTGAEVVHALEEALARHADFLAGSALDIDLGRRPLTEEAVLEIFGALRKFPSITVASITSRSSDQGGTTRRRKASPDPTATLLHHGTVRSGQVVAAEGSLVVVGDVNRGGEVRAGHHIVVTGALRGIAHAGLADPQHATIYAGRLMPTQLRIGSAIGTQSQDSQAPSAPEVAWLEEGTIVVGSAQMALKEGRFGPALPRRTSVNL
jgi:septum site-determining protein MinC